MQRKIVKTGDGSTTIQLAEWNEQYHSMHGAIQEAQHVFLKMGLDFALAKKKSLHLLEIGFGTGLNAFLTFLESNKRSFTIHYEGVEAFPISSEELQALNYVELLDAQKEQAFFDKMYAVTWGEYHRITQEFYLKKRKQTFQTIEDKNQFDLIYFDAFGARVQPELWEESIFFKMFTALKKDGVLVTYSAKGSVRRAMQAVGFKVERLPGPPGKREMLRAVKE